MLSATIHPGRLAAATEKLSGVESRLPAESAPAAALRMTRLPAAFYETTALTTARPAMHVQMFQAVCIQDKAIHQQLVATSAPNAGLYATAEAANAAGAN